MTTQAQANEKLKRVLRAGKLFEGKYRILRPLGAGSFAVVVHARHEVMERDVALKFLKPKVVESNPEVSDRFVKEVQIASRLKHPNIVQIYDFGETEDGIYYMVQEYVDGVTLDAVIDQAPNKQLGVERVMSIVRQVLACLGEAHKHNIIHRDLKPSNLMSMMKEGKEVIKILDFGVAKLLEPGERSHAARQSTKFIGTPIYMSPEQILGLEVGPASDLYSLGLMFYEMLTGQPPIQAELVAEVVQQHLSDEAFSFSHLGTLDERIQKIILKSTRRYPEERFTDAQSFLRALDGGVIDEPVKAAPEAAQAPLGPSSFFGLEIDESEPSAPDVFSGKNYIAMSDEDYPSSEFEPLSASPAPMAVAPPRPAPPLSAAAPSKHPTPRAGLSAPDNTISGLTQMSGPLELDIDAMREVKRPRPRPTESSALVAKPQLPTTPSPLPRYALYAGAVVALLCGYLLLTALTDGMPGPVRVILGLFPLLGAVLWTAFGHATPRSGLSDRWLVPTAQRSLIVLGVVVLATLFVFPGRAEIAFAHEGAWGLSFLPDAPPFGTLKQGLAGVMGGLGKLCGKMAGLLPWAK